MFSSISVIVCGKIYWMVYVLHDIKKKVSHNRALYPTVISASTFRTRAPTRLSLCVCGGHYHSYTIRRHRAVLGNAPNTAVQYARWIVAAGIIQPHIAACPLYGQPAKWYKGNRKRGISYTARAQAAIYSVMKKHTDLSSYNPSKWYRARHFSWS